MFDKRMFSLFLFLVDLVLISFIMIRSGSADYTPPETRSAPLTFIRLPQPPGPFSHTLTLWDFEGGNLPQAISSPDGSCSIDVAKAMVADNGHALRILCPEGGTVALSTEHVPGEWSRYDTLYMDSDNETGDEIILSVQLDPGAHASGIECRDGYTGQYTIDRGAGIIAIPMDDIRKNICGIPLRQTIYLHFPAMEDRPVYLDNIRVVRHDN